MVAACSVSCRKGIIRGIIRITEHSHARDTLRHIPEQLQPLSSQLIAHGHGETGEISSRVREAFSQSAPPKAAASRTLRYSHLQIPVVSRYSTGRPLVDHVRSENEDRIRDRQTDHLGGSEIKNHVELRGLFHG